MTQSLRNKLANIMEDMAREAGKVYRRFATATPAPVAAPSTPAPSPMAPAVVHRPAFVEAEGMPEAAAKYARQLAKRTRFMEDEGMPSAAAKYATSYKGAVAVGVVGAVVAATVTSSFGSAIVAGAVVGAATELIRSRKSKGMAKRVALAAVTGALAPVAVVSGGALLLNTTAVLWNMGLGAWVALALPIVA